MSKKGNIVVAKLIIIYFILTMGFLSSSSTPMVKAQSLGIDEFPFMFKGDSTNPEENTKIKKLFDKIPTLKSKERGDSSTADLNSKSDKANSQDQVSDSPNLKDDDKVAASDDADYTVYTDDVVDDAPDSDTDTGTETGTQKDNKASLSMTPYKILNSILDRLPNSGIMSESLSSIGSPYSSSSLPSSKSSSFSDLERGDVIPGQYIVVLNKDAVNLRDILTDVAKKVNIEGTEILHIYDDVLNGFAIKVANERVIKALEQSPFVDYIERDKVVKTFAQGLPKGINRVDGDLSFTRSGNGYGTINADIAILDTGIHTSHSDLYVYHQKTFISGTSSGNDDNGHGTHVAGIAAAKDNSFGIVGIAPGAKLWAIKVLDKYGAGALSTIIKGIDYIRGYASHIEVANLSLGCECESSAFDTAINNAVKAGITFVVAAGNSGKDASTFSPANNPNVIAVSAIGDSDGKCGAKGPSTGYGPDDSLASFSNYGDVVDIAAPGAKIYSTYKGNTYATMSGTSMASPHVAGAAALYESKYPGSSPSEVRNAVLGKGTTSSTTCDGNGRGYFTGDKDNNREPLLYMRYY